MVTLRIHGIDIEQMAAVIWDKDGTLADSHPYLQQLAVQRATLLEAVVPGTGDRLLAALGCLDGQYDPVGLMAVGTRYDNEIAAASLVAATGRSWVESVAIAQQIFTESDRTLPPKAPLTPPYPGIRALLQEFHIAGIRQAILSGDTTPNIQEFVTYHGLGEWIDWCAGSERPPIKPDPAMLWQACQSLAVPPERCLVIGDSDLDSQLAQAGNAHGFVGVTWGGSPEIVGAIATLTRPEQLLIRSI
jgi:phosphoglycolate phosphatase